MKRKSLIVAAAVATLGVAGTTGLSIANAATDTSSDPTSSLVQKIADKFHLNKSDVQAVFDEQRSEMEAKHEQQVKDVATQAVKDGKITQDQADKIIAKFKEMQANHDAMKGKTMEEERQARQQNHDDMKQWAQDNGISLDTLRSILGRPHGAGPDDGTDTHTN